MKKFLSIFLCLIATIYTLWYIHFGECYKNSGALSKIGLSHHNYFIIWGILTFLALSFNISVAFKKYLKTKVYVPLLIISLIGMILTLSFKFDFNLKVDYYLHCFGSLLFSAITGITIFILFLLLRKNNAIFKIFMLITAVILIVDLICLLIFKETGLIETLPIFAGYILLIITNTLKLKHNYFNQNQSY